MITLHQFPSFFGVPNASPPCMKVETYLRLAKLDYETKDIVGDLKKITPRGQAPFITDKGKDIADSQLIINYLKTTYGDPLGEGLSDEDRAQHAAIRHLAEDHLYFIMLAQRWTVPANMDILKESFFAPVPKMMRSLIFNMAQKSQVKRLEGQGMGKFSHEERLSMGKESIDNLSLLLKEQSYFGGDKAREIDCVIFSYLANGLIEDFDSPFKDYIKSHINLTAYNQRMMQEVFPELA